MGVEQQNKRQGPLLWLAGRSRRFWITVACVLPVAYVLSSGPAQMILRRVHVSTPKKPHGEFVSTGGITIRFKDHYWRAAYFPVIRFQEEYYDQSWGEALRWYWDLFPIPEDVEEW